MKKTKKILAIIIISSTIFAGSGSPVMAWETYGSLAMKQVLEEASDSLKGMLLKSMKQEAIKNITNQVEKTIGGGSGSDNHIIANYEEFIYSSIKDESEEYLSDFFSVLQESASPGEREMLRGVERAVEQRLTPSKPKSTLSEIVNSSDPIGSVFDQTVGGGVKALLSYEFGEYNNPFSARINAEQAISQKVMQLQDSAKTEAIAGQGFETMVDGNSVMPGSIFKELVATAESSPIEMISNATTWQEVIASFATSIVTSAMKKGISTTASSKKSNERRINRSNAEGFPGIQNDIYEGL